MAKFILERPMYTFKFYGPIFCLVMGAVGLCHAEKFQRSLTPKGEIRGSNFFLPPSTQNPFVKSLQTASLCPPLCPLQTLKI